MANDLARDIASLLTKAVAQRGQASLVASGGTTPIALYNALSKECVPWERVSITLSDERWIAPTADGSNEKLLRTHLLRGEASGARFVPLMTTHATAQDAEHAVDLRVAAMPRPFDIVLLGMGTDGHTASLFPGSAELAAALDVRNPPLVRAVAAKGAAVTNARLTLTLRALLDSRLIVVLLQGDEKMATCRKALEGDDVFAAPVRAVLKQSKVPVEVAWAP